MKNTYGVRLLLIILLLALPLGASACGNKGAASSAAKSIAPPGISSAAESAAPQESSSAAESAALPESSSAAESAASRSASSAAKSAPSQKSSSAGSAAPQASSSNAKNNGLKKAPDFTLKNRQGKNVSLSDYAGKIVVLNFWASWCGPCKAEMPEFEELHKKYSKTGDVKILMINQTFGQETKASADAYLNREKFTFEVLYDDGKVGYQTYGVSSYPTTMVVNADGYVTGGKLGTATRDEIEALIKEAR